MFTHAASRFSTSCVASGAGSKLTNPRFAELIRDGYVRVGGRRGDRQFYVATAAGLAWAAASERAA